MDKLSPLSWISEEVEPSDPCIFLMSGAQNKVEFEPDTLQLEEYHHLLLFWVQLVYLFIAFFL